ncbi:hypothetical protein [Neobacillus sp.]|uniref:hypothetical protein n=1 Tax=Neobacillus sp. TaxID=2675273 RepID=UPI0028A1DBAC|nr:hypothetical protein [Neobacillus sp.]
MIEMTFGNITVDQLKTAAGIFIGEKNRHKHFSCETTINEAVGTLSGNENKLTYNCWVKNKETWEAE